ncbi:HK97 gp10 family phage protein [Asaia prunellae]|uniref:HK97 gp10 family phage protein n=1 Tax=Asaia prunellae TaxID=610245 RepID=UPI0004720CD6|nr:HK97 gp10 family phage protein [Asaia prunellae]
MARKSSVSFIEEMNRFVTEELSVDKARALLIADVTTERDRLVASGEASRHWQRLVNDVPDAPETTLRVGGSIVYNFGRIAEAAAYALDQCRARSPVSSGAYRDAWSVLVNDQVWTRDLEDLPFGAEVIIVNPAPYARKIDTGAMTKMSVPAKIVESVRQSVYRAYPGMTVWRRFINLSGTIGAFHAPYLLKGGAARRLAKLDMRSSAFRRGQKYLARRKDLAAGQPVTYPALIISDPDH